MPASTLQSEIGMWAETTFPHATLESILKHLREEVIDELYSDADPSEAADVLLLLFHYAHKRNFDLLAEAERKFGLNKDRTWATPNEHGVSYHL